ncbi:MAG TPA: HemK/PrmC family methyltransferase [Acidimicrobiales bacterium]|nr:HemK/PrmC family methyltransferase [Acidimicrobiales bacterium]
MSEGFDAVDLKIAEQLVKGEPKTIEELLDLGIQVLNDSSAIDAGHDNDATARELLDAALDLSEANQREQLRLPRRVRERYLSFIARRAAGEPIGLILGYVEFCGLRLAVQRGVFLPRPSSVLTVDRTLHHLEGRIAPFVVDLCTGVGPIALAVARSRSDASVWGIDISQRALRVARRNAKDLDIGNARFRCSDLYRRLPVQLLGLADVIVGNIPFVQPAEVPELPLEVSEYEPLFSLTDLSRDGMGLLQRVAMEGSEWLKPGGWLLVQLSEDTAPNFRNLCIAAGLASIDIVSGPGSWDVIVEAQRPG